MNVLITNVDDEVEYLATCAADCQGADLLAYQMVCLTKRLVSYSGGRHGDDVMIAEPTGAPLPPRPVHTFPPDGEGSRCPSGRHDD